MQTKSMAALMVFWVLMFSLNCSDQPDSSADPKGSFQDIIRMQLERYPQMQIEDLYKLTHQAAMGNIHLGVDSQILRDYLHSELEKIEASEDEPLSEEISPDLVRLNLRPFKVRGSNPEKLIEAMMQTAQKFQPDNERIIQYWKVIEDMAEKGTIPFNKAALDSFFSKMQAADFPAIHHSDEYSESYNPAYRVILKQYLPELK